MQHRLDKLLRQSRYDEPRLGIISLWDVENNAVRILAATLRAAGFEVVEIYFKDWISNALDPASDVQLDNLAKIFRNIPVLVGGCLALWGTPLADLPQRGLHSCFVVLWGDFRWVVSCASASSNP